MINISIPVSDCCILLAQSPWRPQKWYFVLCVQVFVAQDNKFCVQEKKKSLFRTSGIPCVGTGTSCDVYSLEQSGTAALTRRKTNLLCGHQAKYRTCLGPAAWPLWVTLPFAEDGPWPKCAPSFACCPHNKSASLLASAALPTLHLLLPATVLLWPATRFGAVHAAALCLILHVYSLQHKQQQFFVTRMRPLWLIAALALLNANI